MKHPRLKVSASGLVRYLGDLQGRRRLQSDADLWRGLVPVLAQSASTGCTFWQLATLYDAILRLKPRCVLELGAGVSTVVLGYAARRVGAEVVSMEEDPRYFDDLRRVMPPAIASCVQLILSPVEDRSIDGCIGRFYAAKPKRRYDLVFVDGPRCRNRDAIHATSTAIFWMQLRGTDTAR